MKSSKQKLEDRNVELVLGNLLRIGVIVSSVIVVLGAIIFLAKYGHKVPHYILFQKKPYNLTVVKNFWNELIALHGLAIIQLGIFCLVAASSEAR